MSQIMKSFSMKHTRLKTASETFSNLSQRPGLKKWRIQGEKFASQARGNIGTFYDEESYFLLQTSRQGFKLERKGHIWIGANVSLDDELQVLEIIADIEEYVGDIIRLTKQTQEHETREFLDLLPSGIKYMMGSYGTYVQFEKSKFVKRLYQVEGKRNIRIKQVPMNPNNLNHKNSFILEDEWILYIWNGRHCSYVERIRTIDVARSMRDILCYGKAEIVVIDADQDRVAETRFIRLLGSYSDDRPTIEENIINDNDITGQKPVTYRIEEMDGYVNFIHMDFPFYHKNQLSSEFGYLIYDGYQAYIWLGCKCTQNVNNNIIFIAQKFMREKNFPEWLPIQRISESCEPRHFRKLFEIWPYKTVDIENGYVSIRTEEDNFDSNDSSKSMLKDLLDDCNGKIKIWCVEGYEINELATKDYGVLYDNTCYIILYCNDRKKEYVIYIWQGILSDSESRDYSMQYAQQIDNSLDWKATQIRMVFGDEPEHFLRLFKGKLMILMDETFVKESSYNVSFYQIVGTNKHNSKAIQLPPYSSFLDSDHVYLLQTERMNYIWEGQYVKEECKDIGEYMADRIAPGGDLIIIQEGFEPRGFWLNLGGKEAYNTDRKKNKEYQRARFSQCSDASGEFTIKEIRGYDQDDLNSDDVIILDTNEEIYIWIGDGANKNEKEKAWDTVKEYLERDPSGRAIEETAIMQVKQGQEPNCFACLFDHWDDKKTKKLMNYEEVKREIARENADIRRYENRKQTTIRYLRSPREERVLKRANSYPYEGNIRWYQNYSNYNEFNNSVQKRYAEPTVSSSNKNVTTNIITPNTYVK